MQIALEPTAKGLGMHMVLACAKRSKYLTADSALKRMQVHAWAFRLDADEHHRSFAARAGGALEWSRRNGGQQALRLGHDAPP